jgi:hypothetical protein
MVMESSEVIPEVRSTEVGPEPPIPSPSRREFMGKIGGAAAAAVTVSAIGLAPVFGGKESQAEASVISYSDSTRARASFTYRENTAAAENIDIGVLPDNGDATQFTDHSGSWSKVLLHDSIGIVNAGAWTSFVNALTSGRFSDFENIIVGNPGGANFTATLNGPQGSLAFDLEGLDSHATNIPPAPSVTSAQTAAEEVEHYWAALMRDIPFQEFTNTKYKGNFATQAAADLNNMSSSRVAPTTTFPTRSRLRTCFAGKSFRGTVTFRDHTSRSSCSNRRSLALNLSTRCCRISFPGKIS